MLVPVEKTTVMGRLKKIGKYDKYLDEFLDSGYECAEVVLFEPPARMIYQSFYLTLKKRNCATVKCFRRGDRVYLVKVQDSTNK